LELTLTKKQKLAAAEFDPQQAELCDLQNQQNFAGMTISLYHYSLHD
jgi:hypothetical protein